MINTAGKSPLPPGVTPPGFTPPAMPMQGGTPGPMGPNSWMPAGGAVGGQQPGITPASAPMMAGGQAQPPTAPGNMPGLPNPLTPGPTGLTQQGLTDILANPWIDPQAKQSMLALVQSRAAVQTVDTIGGKIMFNALGQKVFIPEPKYGSIKMGGGEVPTVSIYDPQAAKWNTQLMTPGAGGGTPGAPGASGGTSGSFTAPGSYGVNEPNLSTLGGLQANEVNQASAKGFAEEQGRTYAKKFDSINQAAASAQNELPQLQLLQKVMDDPHFYSGFMSHSITQMSAAAKTLGIGSGQAATLAQFASKLGTSGTLENLGELKGLGQIRNPEIELLRQSNFSPENTQAANKAVVDLRARLANRQIEFADQAEQYANAHGGRIDRGFEQNMRDRFADRPLVSPQEYGGFNNLLNGKAGAASAAPGQPIPYGNPQATPGQSAPTIRRYNRATGAFN